MNKADDNNYAMSKMAGESGVDSVEKTSLPEVSYEYHGSEGTSTFQRFRNSFKRADQSESTPDSEYGVDQHENKLKQSIKPRHVFMISLGTGIGTGMLVGNGAALHNGGPAGLTIGYAVMGSCLYCIIQAAGELAVAYSSLTGNFNAYPSFLVEPAFGFSVAWVYCLQWLCVFPLEMVTASLTIKYWTTSVNPDIFVTIFYVVIILVNFFGARGYAEAEFFFNVCKVLMISGFFILGIIINCGGAGNSGYIGARYWNDPGAFYGTKSIHHFKGIVSTMVTAAFAFGATEFIALTAAEQANPRRAIPSAAKKVMYRILLIFLAPIVLVGFLVPYTSDELMGSGGSATHASPYVIAVASHGVRVVPHFINAVILLSVLSVGNSAYYSSSRLLLSLAEQGYAPAMFKFIDREGRPLLAMLVSMVFGLIAFVAASPKEETVFTWLLAISGLSQLFTWCSICISHIRFRQALKFQGRSIGELGYRSQTGVAGSYYATVIMFCVYIGQFWVAIAPMGSSKLDANNFFENYLALPILIALYIGYKVWKRDWRLYIPVEEIDLNRSRKVFEEDLIKQEDAEYRAHVRNLGWFHRALHFWC
ncbi:LADA_0H01442g1_1 [Lachancea dasiensis]|uniref:LADA_0H01442g1_1 n=1 Tax=Lachancea dasiensis TaxID=1072105 RepID=A0A1G4JZA0_9SACH|nr:LADA_0H01442g1_1 [Lachancea dasiensis]